MVLRGRAIFPAPTGWKICPLYFPPVGEPTSGWVHLELSPPPPPPHGVRQVLWVPPLLILPLPPPVAKKKKAVVCVSACGRVASWCLLPGPAPAGAVACGPGRARAAQYRSKCNALLRSARACPPPPPPVRTPRWAAQCGWVGGWVGVWPFLVPRLPPPPGLGGGGGEDRRGTCLFQSGGWAKSGLVVLRGRAISPAPNSPENLSVMFSLVLVSR